MIIKEKFEPTSSPLRICLYGAPKTGKTRLATSLPWGTERWGDKAIYIPVDPGSAEMGSVLPSNRERLISVLPEVKTVGGKQTFDPLTESVEIATHDWKKDYPGVTTLIWDTMTRTSLDLLSAYADSGQFSQKHVTFGKPGTYTYHAQPMEGDYGGAQRSTMFILQYLFRQPLNIIVIFHEDHVEPKENNPSEGLYGGPSIAGKAGIKMVASLFDNLFRLDAKDIPAKGGNGGSQTAYRVHTRQKYIWMAGFRQPFLDNPIPTVTLATDPVNFWNELDKVTNATA